MTNNFSLFNEPRRPWLDPDLLKQKFLTLSAEFHPDKIHSASESEKSVAGKRFADLNAAYNCLREPKERLLHLLELEGEKPKDIQRIPPGTMDLFVEIGQTCRNADSFLGEKSKITSPLLKVQMFEKGMEWTDKLNALQQKINSKRDDIFAELQKLNSVWDSAPPLDSTERKSVLPMERLEQLYRILSYIARWTEQIQERVVQLSF